MQIHAFASCGDIEGVAQLLSEGVPVDVLRENPTREAPALTPLMCAVVSLDADVGMVRFLIERGADVNAIAYNVFYQGDDQTVLSFAIRHGDKEKIALLLDFGADINYRCDSADALSDAMYGLPFSPQHSFKQGSKRDLLQFLVARGALPQSNDASESALVAAFDQGDMEALRFLAELEGSFEWPEWNSLVQVMMLGTAEDLKRALAIASEADLNARDWINRTPLLLCAYMGDVEKARLLLAAGASLNDHGHCGQTVLMAAIEGKQVEMLSWLISQGADIEARNEFRHTALMEAVSSGETECVRLLLEAGARVDVTDASGETHREKIMRYIQENWSGTDVYQKLLDRGGSYLDELVAGKKVIERAWKPEIVRMLLAAGADLNDVRDEMRAAILGLPAQTEIHCSREDYEAGKRPRFGCANPEVMDVALWKSKVRSRGSHSRLIVESLTTDDYIKDVLAEPLWECCRFGMSITSLPDGRFIEVGGEFEDSGQPEFCIFNDVFVHYGDGKFDILGYPREVFPPTDFHSATLVDEFLYLIGSIGYQGEREFGETPVYRLNCQNYAIEKVETYGEKPGWISNHHAAFRAETQEIEVWGGKVCALAEPLGAEEPRETYLDNQHRYALHLPSRTWRRLD